MSWDHCQIFEGGLELMAHADELIHSPLQQEAPGQEWDITIMVETCHCPCCCVSFLDKQEFQTSGLVL